MGVVPLGEQLAEAFLDLGAVEAAANDGEGQAIKIRCHAERSSWSQNFNGAGHVAWSGTTSRGERERAVDHTGRAGSLAHES